MTERLLYIGMGYKKGRGNRSFTEPVGVESLKGEKWPLLGPTAVRIMKVL